jgi:hypothetical protein
MTPSSGGYGRAAGTIGRREALYWWVRPDTFTLFFLIPLFVVCSALPDDVFLNWRHAHNFVTWDAFSVAIVALCGFALASRWASRRGTARATSYGFDADRFIARAQYRAILYGILGITLAAYALLLPGEIAAGGELPPEARGRIAGVTSFVNLGPLYVTMLFLQFRLTGAPLSRFDKAAFALFLTLTTARVFLSSERLALLEVLIPIVLIQFAVKGRHRTFMTIAPFVAVIGLAVFFGLTEYFRSWTAYSKTGIPLTEFMLTRLLGYYATAINNGAVIFTAFEPSFEPYFTAGWLVKMPGLSTLNSDWAASLGDRVETVFANYASPEFSNTSGIYAPMSDFGAVGGIAVWIILGAITGRLFRGFLLGRPVSLLLFPTWLTGVYEILRIFYWGGPRYFPVLILTPIVAWLVALSSVGPRPYPAWGGLHPARMDR